LIQVQEFLEKNGIRTVEVALTDLTGALRGKRLPVQAFLSAGLGGEIAFSSALFAWDYGLEVFGDQRYSWETGYPDIFLRPDPDSVRLIGWRPASAFVHCEVVDAQGEPLEISPRVILRRAAGMCRDAGYESRVGLEAEFYLLNPATRRPDGTRNPVYSLHDDSRLEPVLAEIREALSAAELEVEACGAEYAPGQAEINLRYSDPLRAADDFIFFRYVVKQIALREGMLATFMAKPFSDLSGSGLHVHQSLWDTATARNLFCDDSGTGLSMLAQHYLGGLLRHTAETYAVCVPTPNGYKRVADHSFAPTTLSWGADNRSTAVRALVRGAGGTRLESRIATADANPYLAVASMLQAGLAGIRQEVAPSPAVTVDAYESPHLSRLPSGLPEALSLMRDSSFAQAVFGRRVIDLLTAVGDRELAWYQAQVSDAERSRYLEAV
jgi:glutamine synthetase